MTREQNAREFVEYLKSMINARQVTLAAIERELSLEGRNMYSMELILDKAMEFDLLEGQARVVANDPTEIRFELKEDIAGLCFDLLGYGYRKYDFDLSDGWSPDKESGSGGFEPPKPWEPS